MLKKWTINDLADELLIIILGKMTLEDRVQCKLVCKRWKWIIENLNVRYLLITSSRRRSIMHNILCDRHQFSTESLIVNPLIGNAGLIIQDDQLTKIYALKIDLDSRFELNKLKWSRVLVLLERNILLEHLELRIFTTQDYDYLTILTDRLISNRNLKHLSLKKIQFMDFLCINDLELFSKLFSKLVNLTAFECDFCIPNAKSLKKATSKSINRKQLRRLYLFNANSIVIADDYFELRSLGLGLVDEFLLNQLFDYDKYKYLSRLEIKICKELHGSLILNRTIKDLTIHSLGIRKKVYNIVNACRSIEVLSLINCLLTSNTMQMLIKYNSNSLKSIGIQNDYWDDDRQVDFLLSDCFEKCSKLCTGYFKNVRLKYFYQIIYLLATCNSQKFYTLYLDILPDKNEFNDLNNDLPINLHLINLEKDYNY